MFFGISAMHTKAHFIRAVLEGVTYSLYDCLLVLKEMNISPEIMLLCGGGAKSKLWKNMICNTFGMPVTTSKSAEAPALGVAVLAAVGAGIYSSVPEACRVMTAVNPDLLEPSEEKTNEYRAYHNVYSSVYKALKPVYKDLKDI